MPKTCDPELHRFNFGKKPPEDIAVLHIKDKVVGSLGNIVAVMGKPGEGKTLFITAMLASAFTPYDIWGCKITLPEGRKNIAYFDTEQSDWAFYKIMERTKEQMCKDAIPNNVKAYTFRSLNADEIIGHISDVVNADDEISVVFIDGLTDLARNMNSETEVFDVLSFIKKITKERNILIIGVIHQSKRDGFSLGHMGSSIERYGESTMTVEKDESGEFITMTPNKMRNHIKKFEPVTITWGGERFIVADVDTKKKKESQKGPKDYTEGESKIFLRDKIPEKGISYADLITEVVEGKAVGINKAKTFIKYWSEQKWIVKNMNGMYIVSLGARLFIVKDGDSKNPLVPVYKPEQPDLPF